MRGVMVPGVVCLFLLIWVPTLFAGGNGGYGGHELGIFLGDTRYDGDDAFTIGAEYEYRWSSTAGLGLQFEYATSDSVPRTYIVALPFCIHPYGGMRLSFAPAMAAFEEGDETINRGLVRVGFAYAIEICRFSITPEYNIDFMSEHAYHVYGVRFGYRF